MVPWGQNEADLWTNDPSGRVCTSVMIKQIEVVSWEWLGHYY
jgi:hypothetical protein